MIFAVDLIIYVACKVVAKKTDKLLEYNYLSAGDQMLFFGIGKKYPGF